MRFLALVPPVALALAAACSSSSNGDPPARNDGGAPDGALPDGTTPDAGPKRPPGPLADGYVDFSINHVILAGQSNAVGQGADTVLTFNQAYANLSFDTGVMPVQGCNGDGCTTYQPPTSFIPLVEGDAYFYPVETPASGLANQASKLAKDAFLFGSRADYPGQHDLLVTDVARSGNTYWCLSKGGCNYHPPGSLLGPFEQLTQDVTNAKALAAAANRSYVVRAVANIHGESDDTAYDTSTQEFPIPGTGTADYRAALLEWQQDFESTVKGITNQTEPVPMFISQISGFTAAKTSKVAQFQLDAHIAAPGKVILIGPAYHLQVRSEDCLHFDNQASRRIGEYFAKVYTKVVLGGQAWEPVRPKSITRNGAVITAQFLVPKPPLVFDTTLVTEAPNKGFTFTDASGAVIQSVEITGPDTVKITLDKTPSGAMSLAYAQNQAHPAARNGEGKLPDGTCSGPLDRGPTRPAGARGNLHDSDDTPSESGGDPLVNWMVQFIAPVP